MGFLTSKAFLNVLRVAGIIVSLTVATFAILLFIFFEFKVNPFNIITAIFLIFFCLLAIAAEFKIVFIIQWFKFLAPFVGLGAFYVFIGLFMLLRGKWISYLLGGITIGLGVIYIIVGILGVKRMDTSDAARKQQEDAAVKYATNKAQEQNTEENRQKLANAAVAEGGKQQNPFDNDNPFSGNNAY